MDTSNYEMLSRFYDKDWGNWCLQYLPLLKKLLQSRCPAHSTVLDCACGTGVLAQTVASWGYQVHGIDRSPSMISVAQSKRIPGAFFYVDDMINFVSEFRYHLVTCTFDAFNYLTNDNQVQSFLASVARVITTEGILLFDAITDMLYCRDHNGTIHREISGVRFEQHRSYDQKTKIATTIFEFPDYRELHIQRGWQNHEIESQLQKAGFRIINKYGSFDLEHCTETSERIIYVAQLVR